MDQELEIVKILIRLRALETWRVQAEKSLYFLDQIIKQDYATMIAGDAETEPDIELKPVLLPQIGVADEAS